MLYSAYNYLNLLVMHRLIGKTLEIGLSTTFLQHQQSVNISRLLANYN